MSNWKQKIEARIALYGKDESRYHVITSELLQALLDVAVAAEKFKKEIEEGDDYHSSCCMHSTFLEHSGHQCGQCDTRYALDKLREVGDE